MDEARMLRLEQQVKTLSEMVTNQNKVIGALAESLSKMNKLLGEAVHQGAQIPLGMGYEHALITGTALKEAADQGAFDLNSMIFILEKHLDLRRESLDRTKGDSGSLATAEALVQSLRTMGR